MPTPFMGTTSWLVSSKRLRVALTVGVAAAALGLSGAGAYGLTTQDSAEGNALQGITSNSMWSSDTDTAERVQMTRSALAAAPVQSPARPDIGLTAQAGAAEALEAPRVQASRVSTAAPASLVRRAAAPQAQSAESAQGAPTAVELASQAAPSAPSAPAEGTALASAAPPAAPVGLATPSPAPISSTLNARGQAFLASLNTERAAAGLPALTEAPDLNAIASARAWDMVSNGYFAHVSPNGESWLTALQDYGVRVSGGGENLARVSGDASRSVSVAVEHLMESPTHRANILAQSFDEVGIAAVTTEDGVTVFVTIFATR